MSMCMWLLVNFRQMGGEEDIAAQPMKDEMDHTSSIFLKKGSSLK